MIALLAMLLAQGGTIPSPTTNHVSFSASLNYCPGLNASIDAYHGIATGGPIFPNAPGLSVELVSRRRDVAPGTIVRTEVWNDGGVTFQVNAQNCGNSLPALQVTESGINYGGAVKSDCSGNPDWLAGALVHNGYAGSVALLDTNQLTVACSLGKHRAVLPNNEEPSPADYPAGWVRCDEQGCYFPFAGLHGCGTTAAAVPMYGGHLAEWYNRTSPEDGFTAHKAGIDFNGGYWQNHQLRRDQFPSPLVTTTLTSMGQYRYMMSGTLYWAVDLKHWYFTNGSAWVELAEQSTVADLQQAVALLSARVTALEAQ